MKLWPSCSACSTPCTSLHTAHFSRTLLAVNAFFMKAFGDFRKHSSVNVGTCRLASFRVLCLYKEVVFMFTKHSMFRIKPCMYCHTKKLQRM